MRPLFVALFTLREYRRSTWFYLELLVILVIIGLFRQNYWDLGKQDVYSILGFFTIIVTPLTTLRILRLETNARIYIILTKSLSRVEYLLGKVLAALILDGFMILVLFFICFKLTRLHLEVTWADALIRVLPIYLILLMTLFLFLFLSPLVFRGIYFLIGIAYLILGVDQPEQIPPFLLLPISQLIKLCYSDTGVIFTREIFQGLIYAVLLLTLAIFCFKCREINYEPK